MRQTDEEKLSEGRELLARLAESRGGKVAEFHRRIANDPQLINAFIQQDKNCYGGKNVIPQKYRDLIIMALGCAEGVSTTIQNHARMACAAGATAEEVAEVVRLVFFICGVKSLIPASQVFDAIED